VFSEDRIVKLTETLPQCIEKVKVLKTHKIQLQNMPYTDQQSHTQPVNGHVLMCGLSLTRSTPEHITDEYTCTNCHTNL